MRANRAKNAICDTIYEKAKVYLNTRYNDIHVELSYDFTKKLLKHYPQADEDIVLPAILLHDVGWKMGLRKGIAHIFGEMTIRKRPYGYHCHF